MELQFKGELLAVMNTGTYVVTDKKEQLMTIYNGYKNTIPGQSNIFGSILKCYRSDILDNTGDVNAQSRAIETSLREILTRYGYLEVSIVVEYNDDTNELELGLVVVDSDNVSIELNDSIIFE